MSVKLLKCLVCRVLFKLGLIKACKAPPLAHDFKAHLSKMPQFEPQKVKKAPKKGAKKVVEKKQSKKTK